MSGPSHKHCTLYYLLTHTHRYMYIYMYLYRLCIVHVVHHKYNVCIYMTCTYMVYVYTMYIHVDTMGQFNVT